MAALTASRDTPQLNGPHDIQHTGDDEVLSFPIAAAVKVYKGALVVGSGGYAQPGTAATGLVVLGRAEATVDNTNGLAGAANVPVSQGTFAWANSANADLIAQANAGSLCYIVDDNTVALTSNGGTRSIAGVIVRVDVSGVWVEHKLSMQVGISLTVAEGDMLLGTVQTVTAAKNFAASTLKVDNNSTTNAHLFASQATQARTVTLPDATFTVAKAAVASAATAPAFTGSALLICNSICILGAPANDLTSIVADDAATNGVQVLVVQPIVPCKLNLRMVDAGNTELAGTATIVGVGADGSALNEVVDLSNSGTGGTHTFLTVNAFATITSITVAALTVSAGAPHFSVGQSSSIGLPIPAGAASVVVYKEVYSDTSMGISSVAEAVGTVDATARTIIPTTPATGMNQVYNFYFKYTIVPAGAVASHTHVQS